MRKPVIGQPGKIVWGPERPLGVMHMKTEVVFERQPSNVGEPSSGSERAEQVDESILALPSGYEVDIRGIQSRVRIQRSEVAAPNNRNCWILLAKLAANRNGSSHLRSRHHRNCQKRS